MNKFLIWVGITVDATTYPTLSDVAKRLDPDGSVAKIVELLHQTNEMLDDAVWIEANDVTTHTTTVRTGLPQGTWRRLNYGIQPSKSRSTQVKDTIGMLEDYAEVDKDLADLNGNTAAFRLSEDQPHIEGISQQLAQTMIYGDTGPNPERFLGMAPRYDQLGTPANKPVANSYLNQVIDNGGTGADLTSIWLIVWGPNTAHMIYPKGTKAGISHRDLGEQTIQVDAANGGGQFQGYRTHYQVKAGMVVRDWRYVVRLANIEASGANALDTDNMIRMINTVPNVSMGRAAFYCNRSTKTQLDILAQSKSNAFLTIDDVFGKPVTKFWGIPVRQSDQILHTESALT